MLSSQALGQLPHMVADHPRVSHILRVNMRGREHQPRAIRDRGCCQLNALLHRRRTVIDPGQQMKVQLNIVHNPIIGAPNHNPVTIV